MTWSHRRPFPRGDANHMHPPELNSPGRAGERVGRTPGTRGTNRAARLSAPPPSLPRVTSTSAIAVFHEALVPVASGGPRLAVRSLDGRRRPFLLVHGLASNARVW